MAERRDMVVKDSRISIVEQCGLLNIHRSGFYYSSAGESDENLEAMRLMDAYFLEHPHSGVITMCVYLCLDKGFTINIKRVRRLMRLMNLMAIYPKKKLTIAGEGHKIYPYLLRGLKIDRKNQVWATDITYIPMKKGFMYMMAVIDVKTRFILNWSIMSNEGKEASLKTLVNNKTKLIFRYSHLDCEICVDSVLSLVQRITKKNENLLIITDSYSDRDFLIKTQNKKHPYPVYTISGSNLGLSIENKNLPFLFVITRDFRASKIFIPIKEIPYQTKEYLSYVFNFLNESN